MNVQEDFIIIHAAEGSAMYSWEFTAALYNPETKAYYLYEDAGCSCNYPFEEGYWDAGAPMDKVDLLRKIQNQRSDDGDYLRLEDCLELEDHVRRFNPADIDMEEFGKLRRQR